MLRGKLLLAALITCSHYAFADGSIRGSGLYIEPGVTYTTMQSNVNYPAPFSNSSANVSGFGAVFRGGIHVFERFFVAADARYGLNKFQDNGNNISVNGSSWDLAPTIGVQMADYGVRLYGGYILAGNMDPKGVNGYDFRFEDPTGWRVGAGLKLQQLSVNIEWQTIHYGKTTVQSAGGFAAGSNTDAIKFDGNGIVASVTFPIEFE